MGESILISYANNPETSLNSLSCGQDVFVIWSSTMIEDMPGFTTVLPTDDLPYILINNTSIAGIRRNDDNTGMIVSFFNGTKAILKFKPNERESTDISSQCDISVQFSQVPEEDPLFWSFPANSWTAKLVEKETEDYKCIQMEKLKPSTEEWCTIA